MFSDEPRVIQSLICNRLFYQTLVVNRLAVLDPTRFLDITVCHYYRNHKAQLFFRLFIYLVVICLGYVFIYLVSLGYLFI